ncbi:hypothetical protein [Desulfospira joergensenii]|uniref:hypothetical protein n=1 Tax=Desulfospira joergensenii TaxID=53329 RepID=UPI0003B33071|nr:hypothetical protein [Desulfospira joergensenii]
MSNIQPQGEALKKAIEWISERRKKEPDLNPSRLADEAALQFDLSPRDSEFLLRFVKEDETG